jgi:hypothetical protein
MAQPDDIVTMSDDDTTSSVVHFSSSWLDGII